MTIDLRTALVVLAIALGSAVPVSAQAVCEDCQPLTNQLRTLRNQLAEAEERYQSLQGHVAELEGSATAKAREALPGLTKQLEGRYGDVLRLMQAVEHAELQLRQCQRECEKQRQPPRADPSDLNFVDENLPRAACPKCQPHVDRVLDLQRRRRFVRNQLRSLDDSLAAWAGRSGVAGAGQGGQLLLKDRAGAVGRIDDLTAEISQALAELTACNESCVPEPGGGTTLVTPPTGSGSPPSVPPPTPCRSCDEAARALADAAARKKFVEDELAEYERTRQQNEQRNAELQQTRKDRLNRLKAGGQKDSKEAFDLELAIGSHEYEQKVRQEVLGDDPYPKDLQKRLSTMEEEVSALKKKLEDCQKECKPTESSQLFRRPLPYVAGGAVALGALLIGGGDAPTVTAGAPSAPPQPPATSPSTPVTPTPTPTPPPPRTTADGRYRCIGVTIVSDEGRHNATINLGPQLTGDFDVREGSITIRHPAPFVDIVGAPFDTATGRFSGSAVGRVAGSPTVGVSAEGTANTTTGQIVFNYTMGTGGDLPGGRPIVYGITLQKQ